MKNKIIKLTATAFIVLLSLGLFAQSTPPPPGGGDAPGGGNTPVGGESPIDGGLGILLILGAAYAGKKLFGSNELNKDEDDIK